MARGIHSHHKHRHSKYDVQLTPTQILFSKKNRAKKQNEHKDTKRVLEQNWRPNKVEHQPPQTVHDQTPTIIKVEESIDLRPSLITTHTQTHKKREFSQAHKHKLKLGKLTAKKNREDKVKHQLEEIVRVYFTPKAQPNNKKEEIKAIEQLHTLVQAFLNGRCLKDLLV